MTIRKCYICKDPSRFLYLDSSKYFCLNCIIDLMLLLANIKTFITDGKIEAAIIQLQNIHHVKKRKK